MSSITQGEAFKVYALSAEVLVLTLGYGYFLFQCYIV
jgi:hypothetical protein